MSIAARTETAEQRAAIYARLEQRNRLVGILRFGLPTIGGIILAGLLVQLYIGSLVPDFGFANIAIDRDNLVVETPSYSGVGADGTVYTVGARSARAAIGDTDLIHLTGASFNLRQPSGASFSAEAEAARLRLSEQTVTVDGKTNVVGSNGMTGTVEAAEVKVATEQMRSTGPADLTFAGGSTLHARTMSYDGKAQVWRFNDVTLHLTSTPGEFSLEPRPAEEVEQTP
jgi:lipopolysaccharide export system protein LptC